MDYDKSSDVQESYMAMIERLEQGDYALDWSALPDTALVAVLRRLANRLDTWSQTQRQLDRITARVNAGLLLHDILDNLYEDFRELIPYNRIGLALIEDGGQTVRSHWNKSDRPTRLNHDYQAELAGSSLERVIETSQPRILNSLEDYLRHKPHSKSTRLIVAEGMRSSLTCPLIANGKPVGFLFFSSATAGTYDYDHVEVFQRIAAQLSVIIEKGHLVTELAAQKATVEHQNKELEELNELKNTFLGIAAHDLRSPLSVIDMAASVLLDPSVDLSDDEHQSVLSSISEQVRHTLNLVGSLLEVSIIESGKLELIPEEIPLKWFLEKTFEHHSRLAAAKGSEIRLETPLDGTENVLADPLRLRQVMDNLLSNAMKYSPARSLIRVYAEAIRDGWRISVQDEGPGIQPEERQRLFQAFERLSARPTAGERSIGLGLAITRRVVEAHGGQIGAESNSGRGSTFWFTLPDGPR